jgi:hypothetical protein
MAKKLKSMKYILSILLLLSLNTYSQSDYNDHWKIGMSLGLRCEKAFDNKSGTEKFGATNFLFNVPVSYESGLFIAEFSGQYSGDITVSLMGGFILPIGENSSFQLLGGMSDNLYPTLSRPYSLTQKFLGTGVVRLQLGKLSIHAQQIGKVSFFGIGLRGDLLEGTYK